MKFPDALQIPVEKGLLLVPLHSIYAINEMEATDVHAAIYSIMLTNGQVFDFDYVADDAEKIDQNLFIYQQLYPEQFK